MSDAHTPGPWVIDGRFVEEPATKATIAHCNSFWTNPGKSGEEADANLRLVAAAPDLLAAAVALRKFAALFAFETDEVAQAVLAQADAAIAKATEAQS